MNDQQTEFQELYNEYIARFHTDPPIAHYDKAEAIDALRRALATGQPLAAPAQPGRTS